MVWPYGVLIAEEFSMTTKVIRIISHAAIQHMAVRLIYVKRIRRDRSVEKMIYGNLTCKDRLACMRKPVPGALIKC